MWFPQSRDYAKSIRADEAIPMEPSQAADEAWIYQIQVEGRLAENWSTWLSGLSVASEALGETAAPVTTLTGVVADQAALRGVLTRLWNLNLTLISVTRLDKPGR
jgi:hypothetical protein